MQPKEVSYHDAAKSPSSVVREEHVETGFIGKLQSLKYESRPDIRDRDSLEKNFREKFEALNRVHLTDSEFSRLLEEIITPDVFTAAKTLRAMNSFVRDDGTPLNYTLVNIKDWCKNTFEVINQLRINTDNSHHRYDVIILINGVPCVQIELKNLGITPRRAMEQIVEYKNNPGNGYTKTLLCFLQLFTGTPIFEENASRVKIEDEQASMRTTEEIFEKQLHAYTITHAIEDANVLRFHVDYFKPEGKKLPKPGEPIAKRAIVEAILAKHDAATGARRFNAFLATASINDAIEYHGLFQTIQSEKLAADPDFVPLNIACVFSPPAEGDADVKQIQEDLPQEKEDNAVEPEKKKVALKAILADYNARYGSNHTLSEFDLYYQDVQKRIKDQQWPNADLPHAQKIDITIVVDMLLTGFDSKYLNTLYVDKNLKHHGLIQAFSRTNRVLNGTKPYGNILDFRQQQEAVDAAIALFSGEKAGPQAREIWLVEKAPVVIQKLEVAVKTLDTFMKSQGLDCAPEAVPNLKGDDARAAFITHFKEVQRLKTQLDQYTDISGEQKETIEKILPKEDLLGFRGAYLETAQRLKAQQKSGSADVPVGSSPIDQLDFEFVLFASAVIDYDYIMSLIAKFSAQGPEKSKMSREQLVGLISSDAKFMDEREDIAAYIATLKAGEGLSETTIRDGYQRFKADKQATKLADLASRHGLTAAALQTFVDGILQRMIFDGEHLGDLMAPLGLGWKARTQAELALMAELTPFLRKRAQGRDISGLNAYEQ